VRAERYPRRGVSLPVSSFNRERICVAVSISWRPSIERHHSVRAGGIAICSAPHLATPAVQAGATELHRGSRRGGEFRCTRVSRDRLDTMNFRYVGVRFCPDRSIASAISAPPH
jgi:hypothetical protein